MTPKQKTLQALGTLPENASYEQLQEEVQILAALEEAEKDIREGRLVTHEEAKRRLAQWTSS
jgi:predicted transcriptional regulator